MARNHDPVDVRHQAITHKPHLEMLRALPDQFQVDSPIGVGEEDALAVDTALRDVVPPPRRTCKQVITPLSRRVV